MAVRTRDDLARVMAPKMSLTHQDSERYLKKGVQVRFDPDGHSKVIVGDTATLLGKFDTATPAEGSFNMSYQSMFDNQENATYSRSDDYADYFLEVWEKATIPGEE